MRFRYLTAVTALLLPLAATMAVAGHAPASATSCSPGKFGQTVHWQGGKPDGASLEVEWHTVSNPPKCVSIAPRIESSYTLADGSHPKYQGGFIKDWSLAPPSVVNDCPAGSSDCTNLLKAWVVRKIGTGCQAEKVYPTAGGWFTANCGLTINATLTARRSCSGTISGTYFPDQNVWSTKWTRNPGNCQQRSKAVWVQRVTGNHQTTYGGWVRPTTLTSATGGLDTTWAPASCQAQYRTGSGAPVTTITFTC